MKTTIEISKPLLTAAKRVAVEEKTTVRALVEEGLRKTLDARKARRPFQLRQVTYGGPGAAAQEKTWEQIRDLIYEGHGA
jgi:urocanate hydratase